MPSLEANTTQVGAHTDNRHIISMKSRGFLQTPQDIMEKYNGCSVPQYRRYPCDGRDRKDSIELIQFRQVCNHLRVVWHQFPSK